MGDGICGEPNSLEIISQFNRLFQDRLTQIEAQADGGCLMVSLILKLNHLRSRDLLGKD